VNYRLNPRQLPDHLRVGALLQHGHRGRLGIENDRATSRRVAAGVPTRVALLLEIREPVEQRELPPRLRRWRFRDQVKQPADALRIRFGQH
jgi:hypothetical protein